MALPTLRPYYQLHRPHSVVEERIARQRAQETDLRQIWTENSKYFNISNVRASKQEAWTSSKSFQGRCVCVSLIRYMRTRVSGLRFSQGRSVRVY